MSRHIVRAMKQAMKAGARPLARASETGLAGDSALALLERSIGFGHSRLAVIRLAIAVHAGADIPSSHWAYCEEAAQQSNDRDLQALWLEAADAVLLRTVSAPAPAN